MEVFIIPLKRDPITEDLVIEESGQSNNESLQFIYLR